MKALITSILSAIILFSCSQSKTKADSIISPDDKEKLIYLKEVEWPKAYREQDTVLLDRILNDDFQMIDNSGNWTTKKNELDWIKSNKPGYDSFKYEIKRLDIYDNGTAIVSGAGHIVNDTITTIYQSSNVLIKKSNQWKAITSHVSGIKTVN